MISLLTVVTCPLVPTGLDTPLAIPMRECGSTVYVGMSWKQKWPPHTLHCKIITTMSKF